MSKLCIYHGNCADGFTGAWVIRKALGDIEFHPGVYNNPAPNVEGKDVVLVDFSYSFDVMKEIVAAASSVLVLDHHKTAQENLSSLKGAEVVFDMNRSGCRIAWDYYFPNQQPPKTLLHVEDRDLWLFNLPNTREVQSCIFSYEYDFENWDMLMSANPIALTVDGEAIERKHLKDVRELIAITKTRMCIGGYDVPVANLPYTLASDACNMMAENELFAASYYIRNDGKLVFSLRSKDNFDVSAIAKQFGGGGHKNAAGFTVDANRKLSGE